MPKIHCDTLIIDNEIYTRNKYLSKRTKEFAQEYGPTVNRDTIDEILKLVEKGIEIDEEFPTRFFQMYEVMEVDVNHTREMQKTGQVPVKRVKAAELKVTKDPAAVSYDLEIVEACKQVDFTNAYSQLQDKFDFGTNFNQFKPKDGSVVTDVDIGKGLVYGLSMENNGQWIIADAAAMLKEHGRENAVIQIAGHLGKAYSTVSNYVRTRDRVPEDIRHKLLFTICSEIALPRYSNDDTEQKKITAELLEQAVQDRWDTLNARSHVNMLKGKEEKMKDLDKRKRYLVVAPGGICYHTDVKPTWEEFETAIDLKSHCHLKQVDGKATWVRIEEEDGE